METVSIIVMANTIKDAKNRAFYEYGENCKYVKPYRYTTGKGDNFYEFALDKETWKKLNNNNYQS